MSTPGACDEYEIDSRLKLYLETLDSRQRMVEGIRLFHHNIWSKYKNRNALIIQHRSGSRVEKQTRISPSDTHSDIDFMLEVNGIPVSVQENENVFFQPTSRDGYYGRVLISNNFKDFLMMDARLKTIFNNSCLTLDKFSNRSVLVPREFKENVLRISEFEYKQSKRQSSSSPSVPGKGVVNDYDVVPCLKLKQWPNETQSWIQRGKHGTVFDFSWRQKVYHEAPVFLVATGDPSSYFQHEQFRVSFSMIEIECFKKLPDAARRLFGLAKYIVNRLLSSVKFLSWFHVKYLLFWMVEVENETYWKEVLPLSFIMRLMDTIRRSIREGTIKHFFLDDCNIFPESNRTYERERFYECILTDKQIIIDCIKNLLQIEMQGSLFDLSAPIINKDMEKSSLKSNVEVYLTRLLSVIVYVYLESCGDQNYLHEFREEILRDCRQEECLVKLVPLVELYLYDIKTDCDSFNYWIHHAFVSYMDGNIEKSSILCSRYRHCTDNDDYIIGVSIMKHHKSLKLDAPLLYALNELERRAGTCPRVCIHPTFLSRHILVQGELRKNNICVKRLKEAFSDLVDLSKTLCERTPYPGSLSYKSVAMLILQGYYEYFKDEQIQI